MSEHGRTAAALSCFHGKREHVVKRTFSKSLTTRNNFRWTRNKPCFFLICGAMLAASNRISIRTGHDPHNWAYSANALLNCLDLLKVRPCASLFFIYGGDESDCDSSCEQLHVVTVTIVEVRKCVLLFLLQMKIVAPSAMQITNAHQRTIKQKLLIEFNWLPPFAAALPSACALLSIPTEECARVRPMRQYKSNGVEQSRRDVKSMDLSMNLWIKSLRHFRRPGRNFCVVNIFA